MYDQWNDPYTQNKLPSAEYPPKPVERVKIYQQPARAAVPVEILLLLFLVSTMLSWFLFQSLQ